MLCSASGSSSRPAFGGLRPGKVLVVGHWESQSHSHSEISMHALLRLGKLHASLE
jgi:hypothetical protein